MADIDSYPEVVSGLRHVFGSGRTKSVEWRKRQLRSLIRMLEEENAALEEALRKDLRKPRMESGLMEIQYTKNDCINCLDNLDQWMKPEKAKKNLMTLMDTCYIRSEPFGVVLIMGAWNYPVQLTLLPIIGAVAAGNCVLLKPSEVSPATARLLGEILPRYLDKEAVKVINGGVPETTALLKERFDLIFYTGNSQVAKIVMAAAAKYLTPVVLELGGKSPVYVDNTSDTDVAANRISWGKFVNSGQTCVAPDYILCQADVKNKLVASFRETLKNFYSGDPKGSDSFCRIVNNRHFERVKKLLDSSQGKVAIGGATDASENYIEPTVITDVSRSDPIDRKSVV